MEEDAEVKKQESDRRLWRRSCLAVSVWAEDISCRSNRVLASGTSGNEASFSSCSVTQLLFFCRNWSTASL